jgi:glycosyltransferase involved in cell wall biosynthesis
LCVSAALNGHRKQIALVDWNWSGHHPTYFNHLVLALEELGVDVLALCPDPASAERTAAETRTNPAGSGRGQTRFRKINTVEWRFGRVRPRRIGAMLWTVRHFRGIEKQIQESSRQTGHQVDAIFYACMYDWDFYWIHRAQPFLRLPWAGLYIHAPSFRRPGWIHPRIGHVPRPEVMFNVPRCLGIGILDDGILDQVARAIGKPVVTFPDLTEERLPPNAENDRLIQQLKQFAAGRPIIGLLGHLHESKGVTTFLEAARLAAGSNTCFALAGEVFMTPDGGVLREIQSAQAGCPNLWTHLERIADDSYFNLLFSACDVICVAYWDYPHSSGLQVKAAVFQKPVIVSDGYLMAERSRRYRLGEVIPQKDPQALFNAIQKLTHNGGAWTSEDRPQWAAYLGEHSFEKLKASLKKLLATV